MNGWVLLHKKFLEWEWASDPNMVTLFVHLLLSASPWDTTWKGVEIKRGQVVFGRKKWAENTGISEQSLKTCLKRLKLTGEITSRSTNKYTIITISKYNEYQSTQGGSQPAKQPAKQPTTNQQLTSNQPHHKEIEEIEEIKEQEKPFNVTESVADSVMDGLF